MKNMFNNLFKTKQEKRMEFIETQGAVIRKAMELKCIKQAGISRGAITESAFEQTFISAWISAGCSKEDALDVLFLSKIDKDIMHAYTFIFRDAADSTKTWQNDLIDFANHIWSGYEYIAMKYKTPEGEFLKIVDYITSQINYANELEVEHYGFKSVEALLEVRKTLERL